jgi:hypothetical protein
MRTLLLSQLASTQIASPRMSVYANEDWAFAFLVQATFFVSHLLASQSRAKLPGANAANASEVAVRRFAELHGNLRVSSIKRAQVRSLRDAMIKLPKHLPHALQKLPLPRLLEQLPEGLEKRSARTVNKSLRLLSAITNAVANENDFAERPGGWRNPFHKMTIAVEEGEDERLPFTLTDLKTIFASSVYTKAVRPKGGRGEAAFWFPLISLFTGTRLEEIAQLYVRDLQQVPDENR